jgi:hypothetical protein
MNAEETLEGEFEEVEDEQLEDEQEEAEVEETEEPSGEEDSEQDNTDEEEEGVLVTFGDEETQEPEEESTDLVRHLRKAHRDIKRENRELKAKLEEQAAPKTATTLGPKPRLEDHDYEAEAYEQALESWYTTKRQVEAEQEEAEAQQKQEQEAWQARLDEYATNKQNLKVKDFEDAEGAAMGELDQTQQGIIVQGAKDSALLMYALGKNPTRLKELSAIKEPVKFAFAVAKLENDLKVKNRKAPPAPERRISGSGSKAGTVDSNLERLRAEAAKSGDYTKVRAYKQQQRSKSP